MSGASGGLPQLDFSLYEPQIVWLIIFFTILFFVISRIITPHFDNVLSMRKNSIDDAISEAKRLQKKALTLSAEHDDKMRVLLSETRKITEEAESRAAARAAELKEKTDEALNDKFHVKFKELEASFESFERDMEKKIPLLAEQVLEKVHFDAKPDDNFKNVYALG